MRPTAVVTARRGDAAVVRAKGKGGGGGGKTSVAPPLFIEMDEYMSEEWRLGEVAEHIKGGGVGIIPTDTKYAFVADLESRTAVQLLYTLRAGADGSGPKGPKPMSILCRGFSDIDTYTEGFPINVVSGRGNAFKIAKKCIPGGAGAVQPHLRLTPG